MTQSVLPNGRSGVALDHRYAEIRRSRARHSAIRRASLIGDAGGCDAPVAAL
jgi:hypothetical protein